MIVDFIREAPQLDRLFLGTVPKVVGLGDGGMVVTNLRRFPNLAPAAIQGGAETSHSFSFERMNNNLLHHVWLAPSTRF